MMKGIIYFLFVSLSLVGCAASGIGNNGAITPGHYANQIPQAEIKQLYMASVPAPGNLISEGMVVASLEAGSASNSVLSISKILGNPNIVIGVIGKSEAINAATLRAAFRRQSAHSSHAKVYFVGSEKYRAELQRLAKEKNINFAFLPRRNR